MSQEKYIGLDVHTATISLTDLAAIRCRTHILVLVLPTVKALGRHLFESSFDVKSLPAPRTPEMIRQCLHDEDKDEPSDNQDFDRTQAHSDLL